MQSMENEWISTKTKAARFSLMLVSEDEGTKIGKKKQNSILIACLDPLLFCKLEKFLLVGAFKVCVCFHAGAQVVVLARN